MPELQAMFAALRPLLRKYAPPLAPKTDNAGTYDLWSFRPVEIEGRKRKEVFFAALIIQKSYVGFYYMPVYAEPEIKKLFAPELLKLLKGKSCFHIKTLTPELVVQIESALRAGFAFYQERGWV
jgi:hypothetical protein